MSTTTFPQTTQEAKLAATLPVGKHLFKLVVTDDCGTESAPDLVEITVEKKPGEPAILYIHPAEGQRGQTLEGILIGANLQEVQSIKVFHDTHEDRRVIVTPRAGSTADKLLVTIQIYDHAHLGPRTIEVETTHGSATASFTVVPAEAPRILDITPTWGALGLAHPMSARIVGDHLEEANDVTFLYAGERDELVKATIRQASKEFLDVEIAIPVDATLGNRTFSVTTPGGTVSNPPDVLFQTMPGVVQLGIMLLTVVTALIHLALQFPSALFILNGVGYLALFVALYLPIQRARSWRMAVRWGLIAYSTITILAWLVMGDKQMTLGYITKVVELALIGLLLVENYQANRK